MTILLAAWMTLACGCAARDHDAARAPSLVSGDESAAGADPALRAARDEHRAARQRVGALERQVVEAEQKLREAQGAYDAVRDAYLLNRAPAPAEAIAARDEAARRDAAQNDRYVKLVADLGAAAQAFEAAHAQSQRQPRLAADDPADVTALLATFAELSDLMFALEVQAPDAEQTARWQRTTTAAEARVRELRRRHAVLAERADEVLRALAQVSAYWDAFDRARAARADHAARPDDAAAAAEADFARGERFRADSERARQNLDAAQRALDQRRDALREARRTSAQARRYVERLERAHDDEP